MGTRATVYDVAERAGVSIATVSFAFRHPEKVRPKTRDRVLVAAKELGYIPSASARGLVRGETGALGLYAFDLFIEAPIGGRTRTDAVVVDGEEDVRAFPLYVDEVQRGFELECWHQDRALLLSSGSAWDASRVTDLAGRVDGLAVFPGPLHEDSLELLARRLPVVVFSREPGTIPLYHIGVDNADGMHQLVEHLCQVHQAVDVAFVGSLQTPEFSDRFTALQREMSQRGLAAPAAPFDTTDLVAGPSFDRIRQAVAAGHLPQVLVCANDQLALALLDLLRQLDVDVPRDVIVTGFDGILAGRLSVPTLSTVRQPMEEMGRRAVQALTKHGQRPWEVTTVERLAPRLIARGSCGCGDAR